MPFEQQFSSENPRYVLNERFIVQHVHEGSSDCFSVPDTA